MAQEGEQIKELVLAKVFHIIRWNRFYWLKEVRMTLIAKQLLKRQNPWSNSDIALSQLWPFFKNTFIYIVCQQNTSELITTDRLWSMFTFYRWTSLQHLLDNWNYVRIKSLSYLIYFRSWFSRARFKGDIDSHLSFRRMFHQFRTSGVGKFQKLK